MTNTIELRPIGHDEDKAAALDIGEREEGGSAQQLHMEHSAASNDLASLETTIQSGLSSFEDIGRALRIVRDNRLYKSTFETFEQYGLERWGLPRQNLYDYIKAATVADNVRISVQIQPSLSQAVELASLKRTEQRAVAGAIEAEEKSFNNVSVCALRRVVQAVNIGHSATEAVTHFIVERNKKEMDRIGSLQSPISQLGDCYRLGEHRLFVGDATNLDCVMKFLGEERAYLIFIDPPYNVNYEGRTEEQLTIEGDNMPKAEYIALLENTFRSLAAIADPASSMYVCHPSRWQREFQNALEGAGFQIRLQIIWVKNQPGWGFARYKFQHEPILYCHVAGHQDSWYGDRTQTTTWQFNKPSANREHPTMKPPELIQLALMNSSKVGDIVVDLFGGSGSTLIACERDLRRARLMEIDPRYADVIIRRWQTETGREAVLEADGSTFNELASVRIKKAA